MGSLLPKRQTDLRTLHTELYEQLLVRDGIQKDDVKTSGSNQTAGVFESDASRTSKQMTTR